MIKNNITDSSKINFENYYFCFYELCLKSNRVDIRFNFEIPINDRGWCVGFGFVYRYIKKSKDELFSENDFYFLDKKEITTYNNAGWVCLTKKEKQQVKFYDFILSVVKNELPKITNNNIIIQDMLSKIDFYTNCIKNREEKFIYDKNTKILNQDCSDGFYRVLEEEDKKYFAQLLNKDLTRVSNKKIKI